MRYHVTPVRMAITKKSTNREFPGGSVVKKKKKREREKEKKERKKERKICLPVQETWV